MKIRLHSLILVVAISALSASPSFGTEAIMRNVSYDDCTVARHVNSSFAEFFEESANIFEGTVTATGPVPNRRSRASNECWVSFHVDKWHSTSLNTSEVSAIMHTDPNEEILSHPDKIYCPVENGKTYLLFAGNYEKESGTGNTSFYLNGCSLYLPKDDAKFFIGLLNMWNNTRK